MTKEKLPRITEAQIRALANSKSFERGSSYYLDGSISETVRQGRELRGECEGSEDEPYEIIVTLDAKAIAGTSCSCPYEYDGICKHIVALLLVYAHQPQSFRVIAPVEEMLKDHSKEELIAMIGEISRQDSKLRPLIENFSAHRSAKSGKAVDLSSIRKRASRAMRSGDYKYGSWRSIEKELRSLGQIASQHFEAEGWLNAGAAYHALLDESVKGYDDTMQHIDEDGDISIVVDEFAELLGECLANSDADSRTRRDWLRVLLDAYSKDIEIGGIDFASNAKGILIKQTDEEEWAWIEGLVRARAARGNEWEREQFVEFLAEGMKHRGRKADSLVREIGTPEQQAHLLVKEGRIEEAARIMTGIIKGNPGLVIRFADILLEAKAKEAALRFVLAHSTGGWQSDQWLAKYYRKYGTPQEALDGQKKMFLDNPSVKEFKNFQDVCRRMKNWQEIRAEVLAALEGQKKFGLLVEIALHEKDVARALDLTPRLAGGGAANLKMKVAEAAEKKLPREAIKLYSEQAEKEIAGRARGSYHSAAVFLKKVKRLYLKLDDRAAWANYIRALRQTHEHLPAFQDELRKANL